MILQKEIIFDIIRQIITFCYYIIKVVIVMLLNMITNIILIIFPILIYFIFSCYNVLSNKKYSKLLLIITLLTSLYLSLTCNVALNSNVLLFCNVPIVVAYIRKEKELAIILSVVMMIMSYNMYELNIVLAFIKYLLYFLAYVFLVNKKNFKDNYLILVAVVQGFFISFEYFFTYNDSLEKIFQIIIMVFIMYILTFASIYLFNLADRITTLYQDMQAYVNQEKIKNSLFKLTHEIKNPIAVCKGYLDMLDLDDSQKVHKYIPIIKNEIDRSLNIMTDFMEYSKIKLNVNLLDLTILLDDIYNSFNVLLINKNIKFHYNNDCEEVYINGDYDRLKQVFVNIIKNSAESILKKGKIIIDFKVMGDKAIIKVIDDGIGMSCESLNHIKEMFYTTKKNGTGLGVSLSNEIVSLHGGILKYDSVENVGTICTIILPTVRM